MCKVVYLNNYFCGFIVKYVVLTVTMTRKKTFLFQIQNKNYEKRCARFPFLSATDILNPTSFTQTNFLCFCCSFPHKGRFYTQSLLFGVCYLSWMLIK